MWAKCSREALSVKLGHSFLADKVSASSLRDIKGRHSGWKKKVMSHIFKAADKAAIKRGNMALI